MNERFWKIYGESIIGVNEDGGDVVDPIKFAQLIISECAEIALVDGQSTGNFDTFNKIQKHFGVSV
jgi:hypothetical protein